MFLGKDQMQGRQRDTFCHLVGTMPGGGQGSPNKSTQRFKVRPLPTMRFYFDPLQFRTFLIDLQDRPIWYLVHYRNLRGPTGEDLVFRPDRVPFQQGGNQGVVDEVAMADVAHAEIQAGFCGYGGSEFL